VSDTSAPPRAMPTIVLDAIVAALREAGVFVATHGTLPATCADIADDSRRVTPGALFLAVRGAAQDGHRWLGAAATAGATAAIVEDVDAATAVGLPCIQVRDGRRAAAIAAGAAFLWPSRALTLVGVTGTNGKTTTVGLIRHLLDAETRRAASIGTLGVLVGSAGTPLPGGDGLTTPGPVELQRLLRTLVTQGVTTVAMEVSSHALDQRRAEGLEFAAAVFTNLTRDHLDYHGTMEAYRDAKLRLVGLLARDGVACVNADDAAWRGITTAPRLLRFGRGADADVAARDVRFDARGSHFELVAPQGAHAVHLPLIGDFNVANALGAAAVAIGLGMPVAEVAMTLCAAPQVPGRLELIGAHPTVLRDYAHTPDALDRALRAVRPFTEARVGDGAPASRLIVLFGCGGDRDRGKRPEMGRIAEALADVTIVTSDNPRTEDPDRIIDDIEAGMVRRIAEPASHVRVTDRHAAIARALELATPHDVVVLAGKGHETYQIRGTTSYPFDERAIVAALQGRP